MKKAHWIDIAELVGKRTIEGGFSGQCAEIKRQFRTAKHKQRTKQPSNGGGRNAIGRLFVLYSARISSRVYAS